MIRVLRRVLNAVYGLCAVLAALCLAAIAVIILAGAVGRLFGVVVPSANEIAGYLVAASTFLALAPTLRSGGHIRVELFCSRLGEHARRWLELWCLTIATLLVGYLAYASVELVMASYRYNTMSPGLLPVPLWIPQLGMMLGLVVTTLALLEALISTLAGRMPSYSDPTLAVSDEEAGL